MKVTIISIFSLLILAFQMPCSGIAFADGKMGIGAQGGLTFPDFHVKDSSLAKQYSNKDGWLAGAYLEIGSWGLILRPEINFVTKGYSVAGVADVKNHYLEIPLFVKIAPLADAPISPFVLVGPQWSKQTSATVTYLGNTTTYSNSVNKWDISAAAGLGVDFNLSQNFAFNIQGRYAYGFRNVNANTTEINTRAFYALAGLTIQNPF